MYTAGVYKFRSNELSAHPGKERKVYTSIHAKIETCTRIDMSVLMRSMT